MLLVAHLIARSSEGLGTLGWDATRPGEDVLRGAVLAAVTNGSGLVVYLTVHAVGVHLTVAP